MLPAGSVKASIVIPCYNHGQYLKEALASALRSDFDDYEVIIVDDGSTDESTLCIIEELKSQLREKQNVTFISQENQGLAGARNNGIRAARGEYVLPLDADNKIRPQYLNKAAAVLDNNPDIGVVYAYAKYFGEKDGFWEFPAFDARRQLLGNYVEACSVFRRSLWEDCGGYDPNMGIMGYEDWDLWLGVMERGWKFHLIKEVLFEYRVVNGSMIGACNVPENRRHLIKYICNKHRDIYAKNFGYVIAEKDVSILELWKQFDILGRWSAGLEKSLSEKDVFIRELSSQVSNAEKKANESWHAAQDVWKQFEEAGRWSADLEKRLSAAVAEARKWWQNAEESEKTISELSGKLEESEKTISELSGKLEESEKTISEMYEDLDAAREREREKEQYISLLLNSRAYRLGRALTWPVRKMLGRK